MSAWHRVVDSDRFRRLAKSGPARSILASRPVAELDLARTCVWSECAAHRAPHRFDDVRTFCCFVGHNKSGSSLLGALLDAHRDIVVSDEADLLRYVARGFRREQVFALAVHGAEREARKGRVTARRLDGYSYAVPGQWQGRTQRPRVVGDSTTGKSTRRLGTDPVLFDRLTTAMPGTEVKFIQVIRNPFDPISVMMVRGHRSFSDAVDHYFDACQMLVGIRARAGRALLPVRYELLVGDPREGVATVCRFLSVEPDPAHLDACAAVVRAIPDRSRELVEWTPTWIERVESRMSAYDFLEDYSYVD